MARNDKDMKWKQQPSEPEAAPAMDKMEFEEWFASREAKIPKHHHREILKADFKGQGVPDMASEAQWDAALKKYGVALA